MPDSTLDGRLPVGGGRLRIYLGAAPGVGKTYAMLAEGHRRAARGTDVVVAALATRDRPATAAMLAGLEVVGDRPAGTSDVALNLDGVLARRPEVALVDDLAAHWQDVVTLLDDGIDVVSTVNVSSIASRSDVVAAVTGVPETQIVPDAVVRRAEQVELVDMTPEALRRRLAHGNVYPPDRVDGELSSLFRTSNLTALREIALLWLADRLDDTLADRGLPARERVVVGVSGGAADPTVVRRAARLARNGDLLAVHVSAGPAVARALSALRELVEEVGGSLHVVAGADPAAGLLDFARGAGATCVVVGAAHRRRLRPLDVASRVVRDAGSTEVHLVPVPGGAVPSRREDPLGPRRRLAGWLLAGAGPALLTAGLVPHRDALELSTHLVLYVVLTVAVALVGGTWPALVAALAGGLLLNWFLIPPYGTLSVANPENAFALVAFVAVAAAVSSVVDLAARRAAASRQASRQAEALSLLASATLRGEHTVQAVLDRLRETFGMAAATLLERQGAGWQEVASSGGTVLDGDADESVTVTPSLTLAMRGGRLAAEDRRVLEAFAAHAATMLARERLAEQARRAADLEHGEAVRSALLAAVSHDLRTPLAAVKAAVSSLRQPDVAFEAADEEALLASIEDGADRLQRLIDNLLDVSRLQAGAVRPVLRDVALDEVVPRALAGTATGSVVVDVEESLPLVRTDSGLVERILANLVQNAVRHGGGEHPARVWACARPGAVEVRVTDRGRGVRPADQAQIFEPFQRLGDAPAGSGIGLGLAVARGLAEAVGGTLEAEDTPGGGLTMVLTLPLQPGGAA